MWWVCGQKKDLLATPFQRCLHGEKVAGAGFEVEVEVEVSRRVSPSRLL
jgi:hypothetical protein